MSGARDPAPIPLEIQPLDERRIERVFKAYCRAVDRCDEAALLSVYHDDATDDHGTYSGTARGFVAYALDRLRTNYVATQHTLSNVLIEVDGDRATSESYVCATHLLRTEFGGGVFWFTGRYIDQFERRAGTWRILHRQMLRTWDHVEARARHLPGQFSLAEPAPFVDGSRDRQDPVYRPVV